MKRAFEIIKEVKYLNTILFQTQIIVPSKEDYCDYKDKSTSICQHPSMAVSHPEIKLDR